MNFDSRPMGGPPPHKRGKKRKAPPPPPEVRLATLCGLNPQDIKAVLEYTISKNGTPVEGFCAVIGEDTLCYENAKEVLRLKNSDIETFEFEDGFGCALFNAKMRDGSFVTLCRSDMKKKDRYMSSVSDFTLSATGRSSEFGSAKNVFTQKSFGGGFPGPRFGPPGGPPPMGGGPRHGGKGAHGGRACPKCGRPYRPGSSKCISCDKSKGYLKWMFGIVKPFMPLLLAAVVLFFLVTAINLITPYLNRIMVDDYINSKETITEFQGFFLVLLSILGVNILVRLVGMLRSVITNNISCKITE